MESPTDVADKKRNKIRIQQPQAKNKDGHSLAGEVRRFQNMVPFAPDPNLGRVQEIKEEIKKGRYPTREMIEEAAAQLAMRFRKAEGNH